MTKSKVLVVCLVVVVAGLAGAAWLILGADDQPPTHTADRTEPQPEPESPVTQEAAAETAAEPTAAPVQEPAIETGSPEAVADSFKSLEVTMTLHGKVTDANTGELVAGTSLTLTHAFHGTVRDGQVEGAATADAAGEYSMRVRAQWLEEPGTNSRLNLFVHASHPGYATERALPVSASDGAEFTVDFALKAGGGLVLHIVCARSGEPLEGASARLISMNAGSSISSLQLEDLEGGVLRVDGLAVGGWVMSVDADGYKSHRQSQFGTIMIKAGEETDLGTVRLVPESGVTGRIVHPETGEPVAGATVYIRNEESEWLYRSRSTESGADGRFDLVLEPDTYVLSAYDHSVGAHRTEPFQVTMGESTDLGDLGLDGGHVLRVRVVDYSDVGIEGVEIDLSSEYSPNRATFRPEFEPWDSHTTGPDGRLELRGCFEGRYIARISKQGHAHQTVEFELPTDEVIIRLMVGGIVAGYVENPDGNLNMRNDVRVYAVDASVSHYDLLIANPIPWLEASASEKVAAEQGQFRIENLAPGTYALIALTEGESYGITTGVSVEDRQTTDGVSVRFKGRGGLRVTVLRDGVPDPDVEVMVLSGMLSWWNFVEGSTDSSGAVTFDDLTEGHYTVMLRYDMESLSDMAGLADRTVRIVAGEVAELVIEVQPRDGYHLEGSITLNGVHMFESFVLVGKGKLEGVYGFQAVVEREFRFLNLRPGTYMLFASTEQHAPVTIGPIDVSVKGVTRIDRDLQASSISGAVLLPGGEPAAGARIYLIPATLTSSEIAVVQGGERTAVADGSFEFADVAEGDYILTAFLQGHTRVSQLVTLRGGPVSGLRLALGSEHGSLRLISGSVEGAPPSDFAWGMLELFDPEGARVLISHEDGGLAIYQEGLRHSTLHGLSPGTYRLRLRLAGFLPVTMDGVVVTHGETNTVRVDLRGAGELRLTATNPEITHTLLARAEVRLVSRTGEVTRPEPGGFEALFSMEVAPEVPTLTVPNLGPDVVKVRVEVPGYRPIEIDYTYKPGERQTTEATFTSE